MGIKVDTPWGSYELLDSGHNWQLKKLVIKPGQRTSLQVHEHRQETWFVVEGLGSYQYGSNQDKLNDIMIPTGVEVRIPPNTIHRIENMGWIDLVIIEIWEGSYLSEEDITRLKDDYGRTNY